MNLLSGTRLLKLVIATLGMLAAIASHADESQHEQYEPAVLAIVEAIHQGELETALGLAEYHLADFPKSRIGYLLKADILQAMSSEFSEVGQDLNEHPKSLKRLKHQLKNRWQHVNQDSEFAEQFVPASLVYMGRHEYAMVADLQAGRLYLYQNILNRPELVRDYYLAIGKSGFGKRVEGDNLTPVGVYSVNQYIHPRELPDLYGDGAYPVDYPNRLDRSKGRTGYGIWLHGTPSETYARAPLASRGCFVLSNDDFNDISPFISVRKRTPTILSDGINWISRSELDAQRQQLMEVLGVWQRDMQDTNSDAYLAHYGRNVHNFGNKDTPNWDDTRENLLKIAAPVADSHLPPGFTNETVIDVAQPAAPKEISTKIESIFGYPGEKDTVVVQSTLRISQGDEVEELKLEQYWRHHQDGHWQIIHEGQRR